MILFETNTSVFELLWDIALALFILRIAFFYFLLSFLTGCVITYFQFTELQPIYLLTQSQSELVTLPIWLLFTALWARLMIVSYEIPRVGGFRMAIGGLALVLMLCAELVSGVFMYEKGYAPWIWETDYRAAGAGVVVLSLFALMPLLLMQFEKKTDEMGETYHGHEKKAVIDAVPTLSKVAAEPLKKNGNSTKQGQIKQNANPIENGKTKQNGKKHSRKN